MFRVTDDDTLGERLAAGLKKAEAAASARRKARQSATGVRGAASARKAASVAKTAPTPTITNLPPETQAAMEEMRKVHANPVRGALKKAEPSRDHAPRPQATLPGHERVVVGQAKITHLAPDVEGAVAEVRAAWARPAGMRVERGPEETREVIGNPGRPTR
jgi:hypothetical protein